MSNLSHLVRKLLPLGFSISVEPKIPSFGFDPQIPQSVMLSRLLNTHWITKLEKDTSFPLMASFILSITSIGKRIVLFSLSLRLGLI